MSATRLARPDVGLLTQTEVLENPRASCAPRGCAVIVDIDTGYGGTANVERTVGELLRMGAAGCFLEDQVWPKRCGHMDGKRIVALDEYLPKLARPSAPAAATPFHVTARTDARAAWARRGGAPRATFADAGADAVFVEAPESIGGDGARPGGGPGAGAAGREHGRPGEDAAAQRRRARRRRAIGWSSCRWPA